MSAIIIASIDREINRLQEVRAILTGSGKVAPAGSKRRALTNGGVIKALPSPSDAIKPKRVLSPEARERIAAAQRKRHAVAKKAKRASERAAAKAAKEAAEQQG